MKIKAVSGTQDILPAESYKWQFIENRIRHFMSNFHYTEVRTPIFEYTQLFSRGIGELTDIVSKEMYTFPDSGDKMLTLRPENTASVARMNIEYNLMRETPQNKQYYIGPMFRRERPQKGRYRQFHQFGVEAIGPKSAELDVEVILLAMRLYQSFDLNNMTLHINSVGDHESRDQYKIALKEFVRPQLADYCDNCKQRFEKNPLRILDCKIDAERNKRAPHIIDHLTEQSKTYFDRIVMLLEQCDISYTINHSLVRGLDYYSDIVFEITCSDLGAQSAICGGGRYDYLFSELGGKETPSVGFAGGLERLILALDAIDFNYGKNDLNLFIATLDAESKKYAIPLIDECRAQNLSVDTDYLDRGLKAQMKYADKIDAQYVVIIGEDERAKEQFQIKHMESGTLTETTRSELISTINQMINHD